MLQVSFTGNPQTEELEVLHDGLSYEAYLAKGLEKMEPFAFFLKDGEIKGGISGFSYYGCHYIDALWLHPTIRGKGYGTQLLHLAENLAKERNCQFLTVNTMDWEALSFYEKHGYYIEFQRDGYEKDSTLIFLRKNL